MRRYELDINGKRFSIAVHDFTSKRAELEVGGTRYTVEVADIVTEGDRTPAPGVVRETARPLPTAPSASAPPPPAGGGGAGSVTAPIPGQVLAVMVQEGDVVKAGQPVLKMEAMKMENVLNAPVAGTVVSVGVNAGDVVMQGEELMVIG